MDVDPKMHERFFRDALRTLPVQLTIYDFRDALHGGKRSMNQDNNPNLVSNGTCRSMIDPPSRFYSLLLRGSAHTILAQEVPNRIYPLDRILGRLRLEE